MQPAPPSPEIHERSEQPDAQRDAPVSCQRQRQREEQPVERIEQRRLHGAKKRCSSKNVRIPQGEVALRQLAEAEFSPPEKMQRQVVPGIAENARTRCDERVEEHRQGEQREAAQPDPQRPQSLSCKLRMLSRNEASMISMPPTIRAAAAIVSRITTLGSNAPKPASRHCQKAAPLHKRPHSATDRPSSRPRSSVRVLSSLSRLRRLGSRPAFCAETRANKANRHSCRPSRVAAEA